MHDPKEFPNRPVLKTDAVQPGTPRLPEPAGENDPAAWDTFHNLPVAALGGSAGSIGALETFFRNTPDQTGIAYVVILHLSPEHESSLPQVIQRWTSMKVLAARNGTKLEANSVYVIPPAQMLVAVDGHLCLSDFEPERGKRVVVDIFFRSLAEAHGPYAVAIVLSGLNADGAVGIKRIKERGGLTIAQEPEEAEHSGMPRSAISTGMIDWVLPVADMPQRIIAYTQRETRLKLPPEKGPQPSQASNIGGDESELALREVLTLLRVRTGRDFSSYKRATIVRRISRRMQINGLEEVPAYLTFLRTHPGEAGALLHDLLISVTNFFRDREAFGALEALIPEIFRGKGPEDAVRVWVPACATGEEAYSIAILLLEHTRTLEAPPSLQVFGCDLDEDAIQSARSGVYMDTISADVSEERLRRFFTREHHGYRVRREVREIVLFAPHDLLKDAPFSRMDLISCRNLLIYLNREAQRRVFDTFHFALKPHGVLYLGSSESVEDGSPLFSALDKNHRIYRHRPFQRMGHPVPSGSSMLIRSLEAHEEARMGGAFLGASIAHTPAGQAPQTALHREEPLSLGELHFRLVERLAPPSVVVTSEHEIVHLSENAGKFLEFSGGEPTMNLLHVVHPLLRNDLRRALFQAAEGNTAVEVVQAPTEIDGIRRSLNLRVSPARELAPGYLLVTFELTDDAPVSPDAAPASSEPEPIVRQLEREIEAVKKRLRDTAEQYEANTEELKASNGELQSMNEELRSATEELETSREELQSINEEFSTVNQELKNKLEELGHANSDLHNLMNATAIATVFLDRDLRIMRYTPSAVDLFRVIPSDIGRPLADLRHRLEYAELTADALKVLDQLVPVEREVKEAEGRWFLARLLPYRTLDDHIAGVVLTFVDITERRLASDAQRESELRLADDLAASRQLQYISTQMAREDNIDALYGQILDSATIIAHSSMASLQIYLPEEKELRLIAWKGLHADSTGHWSVIAMGMPTAKALEKRERMIVPDVEAWEEIEDSEDLEAFRRSGIRSVQGTPLVSRAGQLLGMISTHWTMPHEPAEHELALIDVLARQTADLIERFGAEQSLRQNEEQLRLIIESVREYAIFTADLDMRVKTWNPGAERLLGYSEQEILGQDGRIIFTPEDRRAGQDEAEKQTALREGHASDVRWHLRKDGSRFWSSGFLMAMHDRGGETIGFVKILRDDTSDRESRQALEESRSQLLDALHENEEARRQIESTSRSKDHFIAVLSHELRTPLTPVIMATESLLMKKDIAAPIRDALEMIHRNTLIETRLIDDLLDLTRVGRGKLEIEYEALDIHGTIQSAAGICAADVEKKNQRLTLKLEAARSVITGDFARMEQVIWNLLKNASKFTAQGGKIEISTQSHADTILIAVTDNGIGIAADKLDEIFNAFEQGGAEITRSYGGLGLGLAISKAIVVAHEGTLRAESDGPGKGASFVVELPIQLKERRVATSKGES